MTYSKQGSSEDGRTAVGESVRGKAVSGGYAPAYSGRSVGFDSDVPARIPGKIPPLPPVASREIVAVVPASKRNILPVLDTQGYPGFLSRITDNVERDARHPPGPGYTGHRPDSLGGRFQPASGTGQRGPGHDDLARGSSDNQQQAGDIQSSERVEPDSRGTGAGLSGASRPHVPGLSSEDVAKSTATSPEHRNFEGHFVRAGQAGSYLGSLKMPSEMQSEKEQT